MNPTVHSLFVACGWWWYVTLNLKNHVGITLPVCREVPQVAVLSLSYSSSKFKRHNLRFKWTTESQKWRNLWLCFKNDATCDCYLNQKEEQASTALVKCLPSQHNHNIASQSSAPSSSSSSLSTSLYHVRCHHHICHCIAPPTCASDTGNL